ncbi:MAG: hypothetical protein ACJATI_000612 [Halioglobus sp.]|jgi:hypothetical protein
MVFTLLIIGCGSDATDNTTATNLIDFETIKKESTKFKILSSDQTGINAMNKVEETENFNYFLWSSIYMGSGVGVADFNNDGLPDIYMGQNMTQDKLYLNKGDMKFDDISDSALPNNMQWTAGVSVVDINNDGWMDIYLCSFGPSTNPSGRKNRLLVNQKNNTFKEESKQYGIDDGGFTVMATFFDVDKDGDKDLYVVNQPMDAKLAKAKGIRQPDTSYDYSDKLYIRNKSGRYIDRSKAFGVDNHAFGLNVLVNDINEDGWLDLYITNDYDKPDYIYINQEGKGFKNELEERVGHISNFAMGSDIADINNDGLNDIITLDMSSSDHYKSKTNMSGMDEKSFWLSVNKGNHFQYMFNALQLNQGGGYYSEIAQMGGVAQTDWSWSVILEDFNMDGLKDAYVTNGIKRDVRNNDFTQALVSEISRGNNEFSPTDLLDKIPSSPISNYLYEGKGKLKFDDVTTSSGAHSPDFSTGCAVADFDRDGDLDIIVSVSEGSSKLLENQTPHTSKLLRYSINSNLWNEFLNAKFVIQTNCGVQRKDIIPTRGYNSSSWDQIIFSVPQECDILDGVVTTIYGDTYKLPFDKMGEVYEFSKENLELVIVASNKTQSKYFTESEAISYSHKENKYNDYNVEVLLPHKLSENGPCTAVADVDGDGEEELFIGGSRDHAAQQLFNKSGKWVKSNSLFWESIKFNENRNFTFFDSDGDGDQDLYIVNGGNESTTNGNDWLVDQLLLNDGKGNFKVDSNLPKIGKNTSVAIAKDIDSDGDQDLVVFGGHKIGAYPESFSTYILENIKGKFSVNEEMGIGLEEIGLVSDATEVDYNNDGKLDIVTVGEWSIPYVIISDGKKLKLDLPNEMTGLSSWWNTIEVGDLNNDGRPDLVIGSFGDNNKFHPSKEKPLEIFGRDFDASGTNDIVLAKHYKDKVVPTRGRECSSQQIPNIKEKFPTYNEFALAGIEDILGEDNIQKSVHKKINGMSHKVLWNMPTGWVSQDLPAECQISPLKSIVISDVNGDGVNDVIGIGNHYGAEVETARYDAGYGWVLLGNQNNKLQYNSAMNSGIWFKGDGRSIVTVKHGKKLELLAFFNNGKAKSYTLN